MECGREVVLDFGLERTLTLTLSHPMGEGITPHMDVTAWQYDRTVPVPVWVARRFHSLGDGRLAALARDGSTVQMHEGDWAVTDGRSGFVLTDAEFNGIFHGLPQAAGREEGEAMTNAS